MQARTLYDRPDLYDPLAPPDSLIASFYVDMARDPGDQVLDLACGSGRFTIPLAEAGKQVVGGDLSPEILQRARPAAEARGVKAEFVQLDMRDFDLGGRRFDTIKATNGAFNCRMAKQERAPHAVTPARQRRVEYLHRAAEVAVFFGTCRGFYGEHERNSDQLSELAYCYAVVARRRPLSRARAATQQSCHPWRVRFPRVSPVRLVRS